MSEPDKPLLDLADIPTAIGLLSRLPVQTAGNRGAASAWAFPLVGLITGAIAAAFGWMALSLGLPANLTAGLALVVMISITGAMHEDGLADTIDGLWGGWDKIRRLEIMKDSHIGAYGVIGLVLSLILRWAALTALAEAGMLATALMAVAILSRIPMVVMMALMPNARAGGLSASVGRVGRNSALMAVAIGAIIPFAMLGWAAIVALIAVALAGLLVALIALRKIGGQTGDILGASQQVAEIVALIALATSLA